MNTEIKLKKENERLRKEIEKANLFKQMVKDLVTRHFGVKEFSTKQTILGCLEMGIRDLKFQNSLVECEDCKSGIDTPTTSGKWLCDDCIENRLAWEVWTERSLSILAGKFAKEISNL